MAVIVTRRVFLGAACAAVGGGASAAWTPGAEQLDFRISLVASSLRRALGGGSLDHLDLAAAVRNEFGLDAVEYVGRFFKGRVREKAYLAEMTRRAGDHGVRQLLVFVDCEAPLGHAEASRRKASVEAHLPWLEAARALGCQGIVVNVFGGGSKQAPERAVEGLLQLVEHAAPDRLGVMVANWPGQSNGLDWLADVIETVRRADVGGVVRLGRLCEGDPAKTLAPIAPHAKGVSVTSYRFDDSGHETSFDFVGGLNVVLDAGYRGYVGIDYAGKQLSESQGVRATLAMLNRVLIARRASRSAQAPAEVGRN